MYKTLTIGLLIAYFVYHTIAGTRGLLATRDVAQRIVAKKTQLETLQKERHLIELKLKHFLQNTDKDLIDELARKKLGMADPDDVVVILPKQ